MRYSYGGKQVRESAETTNKKAAEKALAKIQAGLFAGTFFPEKRKAQLTLGELQDRWLEHAKHKKSARDDASRFVRIIEFFGEDRPVSAIDSEDVTELREALINEKTRRGVKMAPATVNRHLALLRSAIRYADSQNYVTRRLTIRLLAEDNERDRICSPEEYAQIIAAAPPTLRLAVIIAYWSGMRLGEIGSLRWEQIDLKARVARLKKAVTKTRKSRDVALSKDVVAALEAWQLTPEGARRLKDSRVFNLKHPSSALAPLFTRLMRKLGIVDLHFHDLRHTAATRLRRAGVDVLTIQSMTGHKTLEMLRRYNTITADDLRAAMEKAEAVEDAGR